MCRSDLTETQFWDQARTNSVAVTEQMNEEYYTKSGFYRHSGCYQDRVKRLDLQLLGVSRQL